MFLLFVFICLGFFDDSSVNCANNVQFKERAKNNNKLMSTLNNLDSQMFCKAGCVLNDPKNRPRIDDPGRNVHDKFSVISTSYVEEVIGTDVGLTGRPLRVMASRRTLSKILRTSIELHRLSLSNGEVIQRITFELKTEFSVARHPRKPKSITVRIYGVVPHVILMYDFALGLSGEKKVSGVVSVEVSDYPRALEVEVVRGDHGTCWLLPVDETEFKNYQVSVKVRGENRHVIGTVSATMYSELIGKGFPFEIYMQEINEFAFNFLTEALERDTKFIKTSSIFNNFCDTISKIPDDRPDSTTDRDRVDQDDTESSREHRVSSRDDRVSSREDRVSSREDCFSSRDGCYPRRDDRYPCEDDGSCEDNPCADMDCECDSCQCKKDPCGSYEDCSRTIRINIKD